MQKFVPSAEPLSSVPRWETFAEDSSSMGSPAALWQGSALCTLQTQPLDSRLWSKTMFMGQGISTFSEKPNSYCWVILCCFYVWLEVTQVCFVREWKHKSMARFQLHEIMTGTMTWETILCFFQSCHWWDFIWLWLRCISQASDVELPACLSSLCRVAFVFYTFLFSVFLFLIFQLS